MHRLAPLSRSELARFRQRFRNHVHDQILTLFLDLQGEQQISQKGIAERLGFHPSRINRLLSDPANMTLDTISDLMLAMNGLITVKAEHFERAITQQTTPDAVDLLQQPQPDSLWLVSQNAEVKSSLPRRDNEPANDDTFRKRTA